MPRRLKDNPQKETDTGHIQWRNGWERDFYTTGHTVAIKSSAFELLDP